MTSRNFFPSAWSQAVARLLWPDIWHLHSALEVSTTTSCCARQVPRPLHSALLLKAFCRSNDAYCNSWSGSLRQGWAGKAFWLPGTGREIENHFPVLREGNGNSQIATGREGKGNLRLVIPGIPGNPGNHIKSKIKFKIIFMPWQAIRSQSFFNQCKDDICNRFTQL